MKLGNITGLVSASLLLAANSIVIAGTTQSVQEVIVTLPIHREAGSSAQAITVLSGEELKRDISQTLGETLAKQPGISNNSFGPSAGRPVIRGLQGARVSVLQNSTGSSDVSSVSPDHAVSVEPVLARSVEVLRGPSTLVYSGAIGGIVNVIDNRIPMQRIDGVEGELELRHGSVNDEAASVLAIDAGSGDLAFHIDGFFRETNDVNIDGDAIAANQAPTFNSEDVILNTDSETQSYTLGGTTFFDNGMLGVSVNRLENEYGIPPSSEQIKEGEFIRIDAEQTRYDVRGEWQFSGGFAEELRGYLTYNDYKHSELEAGDVATEWNNEIFEARIELQHSEVNGFHGAFGAQFIDRDFAAVGLESYIPPANIQRWGIFFVEDYHLGAFKYEAGLRYDHDEVKLENSARSESFDSLSASASVLWALDDHWRFGLALAHAERAPEVEELYADGPHLALGIYERGNENIGVEHANNVEFTLAYEYQSLQAELTVFHNRFSGYIQLQNTGDVEEGLPVYEHTQQDAQFVGAEFTLDFPVAELSGTSLRGQLFGDWVEGELDASEDVPRIPPLRVGLELTAEHDRYFSSLRVFDVARQDKPGVNQEQTRGYTRVDASVDYQLFESQQAETEAKLFLQLNNLTDAKIRNAVSFLRDVSPEPGRSAVVGLRFGF